MYELKMIDGDHEKIAEHLSWMLTGAHQSLYRQIIMHGIMPIDDHKNYNEYAGTVIRKAQELMDAIQDVCGLYGLKYYPWDEMIFRWLEEPLHVDKDDCYKEKDYRVFKFYNADGTKNTEDVMSANDDDEE